MNLTDQLSQDLAQASSMTFAEVEAALEDRTTRTIGELTALSLAKKAAEGGMDAVKLMRDLAKTEAITDLPRVEIRVIGPEEEADG